MNIKYEILELAVAFFIASVLAGMSLLAMQQDKGIVGYFAAVCFSLFSIYWFYGIGKGLKLKEESE